MKLKIVTNYIVLAFLALQLMSCDNKDVAEPLFDATVTERINARSKELDNALQASEFGWKAIYYTDISQLGGFTYLFKFKNDGSVDMASDFNDDSTTPFNSRYSIDLGSTVSLVFTTKNSIHLLSDSNNSPTPALRGKGYKGEFQFLYYGQENEQIIFRTNKSGKELRFVKATAQDWADLTAHRARARNLTSSVFHILETYDGASIRRFNFNLNLWALFATPQPIDGGPNDVMPLAIRYTPTGITVTPAIELGNQRFTDFIHDASGDFTAQGTSGAYAKIRLSPTPLALTDDYQFLLPGQPRARFNYVAENLNNVPTNSPLFKILESQLNSTPPTETNSPILRINLIFNDNRIRYITYQLTGRTIFHVVNVVADPVNKSIRLTHRNWQSGGAIIPPPAFLANLDAQLINTPLYVKRESFTWVFSNVIYTFANGNGFRISCYYYPE